MTDAKNKLCLPLATRRIWEIDFLRGLCIVLMIFDHMMFDFGYIPLMAHNFYEVENAFFEGMVDLSIEYWWYFAPRQVIRYSVVFLFLFLSGISCSLTRSNWNRLRKLTAAAATVTVVTVAIDAWFGSNLAIVFGILHMLALCVLTYLVLKAILDNRGIYLVVGLFFATMGLFLQGGDGQTVPFWEIGAISRNDFLYEIDWDGFMKVLAGTHLYGSDSYGVFPYLGFFLLGAGTGATLYTKKRSLVPQLDGGWNRVYTTIGRYGVYIYLAHQMLVFVIIALACMAVGYRF